jgi:hypothetical protein
MRPKRFPLSDYTLPPCSTLICGMTGSGKTSFAFRYLLNVPAACRFIFDDLGQAAARLRISHASTGAELESALASKWVVFNPHRMFPGDTAAAFSFFCKWAFASSQRGPGKKVVLVDEIWRWCSPNGIPKELAMIAQAGRAENIELISATQLPHKVHASITGQSTEIVCFRLAERLALASIQELSADPEQVRTLPLGSFVSYNRITGTHLAGRLF